MTSTVRSAVTLTILVAIMAIWLVWGYSATTKPFPGKVAVPTCVDIIVPAGSLVTPGDITVSVLNAGNREGLAGRTMQLFLDQGFAEGDNSNAPKGTAVPNAQIWTDDPGSPAVRLLASRIPGVEVVEMASPAAGITVVVGDEFQQLAAGKRAVKARRDAVVCGPSV